MNSFDTQAVAGSADKGDAHVATASRRSLFVNPHGRRDGFWTNIRGHVFDLADPRSALLAPTPDDLYIASIASALAWSARSFLRTQGLRDDVCVAAEWLSDEDPTGLADINVTIRIPRCAEAVHAALSALIESSLAARLLAKPEVHISLQG